MRIKTVGSFGLSGSFASEVRGKFVNEGFDAAWNAIPKAQINYEYEEIDMTPTYVDGNRGIWIGKQTVAKFYLEVNNEQK